MCVGAGLEQNSAGLRPPGTEFDTPALEHSSANQKHSTALIIESMFNVLTMSKTLFVNASLNEAGEDQNKPG